MECLVFNVLPFSIVTLCNFLKMFVLLINQIGKDGKLVCPKCKKTFGRLRHFNTHRCLATGDYGILSDDEEEENEFDQTPDYKPVRRDVEQVEVDEREDTVTQGEPQKKHTSQKSPAGK